MTDKPTYEELEKRIQELEQSEASRRENARLYRFLTENMVDIVWITDRDFRTTYVSPSIENVLGFTVEERKRQTLEEMITPESLEAVQRKFLEELEHDKDGYNPNRSVAVELEYYKKDGDTVWLENIIKALRDDAGEIVGLHGVSRDITERKQSEERLRESESMFRDLFELSPQAISLTDVATGRMLDINAKFSELTQYTKEVLIGKTTTEGGFYTKEDRNIFINALQSSGEVDGLEMNFKVKDGTIITALMFARVIKIGGKPLILTVFNDVTTQKRLEDDLRQAHKMEAIGTLAGGIAHEFNNILGIIIGNTELALDDVPEWNPAKDCLKEIRLASLRAKDVVRQILSFARKTPSGRKPVQVSAVIANSLKLLRSSIPTTINVQQEILCESELISANPTEINQVLINLCTNSFHAMENETGALDVRLETVFLDDDSTILHEGLKPGKYVKLTVKDTGQGIAPEIMGRIFDPYFTTKNIDKGLGMGLAVVYGIVKKQDGDITIKSEVGKGTTVEVLFPVVEAETEAEMAESKQLPTGTECILLVDDEVSLVKIAKQVLERLGYQVVEQTDSIQALAQFRAEPDRFDLVITDLAMPQMAGDLFVQELNKIRSDVPIILCTGHSSRMDEDRAKDLGIKAYAMKPLDMSQFAQMVRGVLDHQNEY